MNPLIELKKTNPLLFTAVVLACFMLLPTLRAVTPAPDGGYPGGNTAEGFNALFNLSPQDGGFNTAVGFHSLSANVTGSFNTAVGAGALVLNTSHNNTAAGAGALLLNTTGTGNTATGAFALVSNGTGDGNTAVGAAALTNNDAGAGNTAVGAKALFSNIGGGVSHGHLNTAVGLNALTANTIGDGNTAVGAGPGQVGTNFVPAALGSNTTGRGNTAIGGAGTSGAGGALGRNTEGNGNTAIGQSALAMNTTGADNIALGTGAGENLTTGSNNIDIGNAGVPDEANTIRIGTSDQTATYIAGISGTFITGSQVGVTSSGRLGVLGTSSARFKDEIKPMDKVSEAILALKPVTFHYKKEIDPNGTTQFGLVAEEVEKVNSALITRDRDGKPYTVRYEAVNAMLLNEFLKARRQIDVQQKQIEALTAGLQKASAKLELSKAAPQTVLNSR